MKQWLFKPRKAQSAVIYPSGHRAERNAPAERPLPSLALCIAMDLIGMASFGIPILGEVFDLIWAPISAGIYYRMFGGKIGILGGMFDFLEELLPGTDIIPTFTITWFIKYAARRKQKVTYYPAR